MEPIISGTTTERIVRATLVTAMLCGAAIWFLWDGYVSYARENVQQLLQTLGLDADQELSVDPGLTDARARELEASIPVGSSHDDLKAALGPPSLTHKDQVYYLGPGGHLRITIERGSVAAVEWAKGIHWESSQAHQRWLGYVLAIFGLVFLVRLFRVVTTRVSLTEGGFLIRGHPEIPFAAMKSLRPESSGKVGLVDLEYDIDGRKGVIRLDDYVIREYDHMLNAICEKTGLPDPRKKDG